MGKKRKTYYIDEDTIQKIKWYAHEQSISENEAFENAVDTYEKLVHNKAQFFSIPVEHKPLLLEAVDNLIYQTRQIIESSIPEDENQSLIKNSLKIRLDLLKEVRSSLNRKK